MRKLLIITILGFVAWKGYGRYAEQSAALSSSKLSSPTSRDSNFTCDGRKYCSQMTSCAEAMYFLKNCPGVKMDGSGPGQDGPGDGIPCERQWCGDE
jgi:hypothetical protein